MNVGRMKTSTNRTHCQQAWIEPPTRNGFKVISANQKFTRGNKKESEWSLKAIMNKVVTILCMIACFCLCCWQLSLCIRRYLSFQVIPDVSIKHFQAIPYPAMTICSSTWNHTIFLPEAIADYCEKTPSCKGKDIYTVPFEDIGLNLDEFWLSIGVPTADVYSVPWNCSSAVRKSSCKKATEDKTLFHQRAIPTLYGSCVSTYPTEEFYYQVQNTDEWHVKVKINPSLILANLSLHVLVHTRDMPYKHDISISAKTVKKGQHNTRLLVLGSKNFNSLDTMVNRCWKEEAAVALRSDCIERKINEVVNCKLPFFPSSKEPCRNLDETLESCKKAVDALDSKNIADCQNYRVCNQTIYSITMTEEDAFYVQDVITFYLNFLDNVREMISENFDYTLSSLLSDIAGNTGFFLGVSLVGMIESAREKYKEKQAEKKKNKSNHQNGIIVNTLQRY